MKPTVRTDLRVLACTLGVLLAMPGPLRATPTQISDEPLAQPATNVKPNIMLILDDSGSMTNQFTPDYMADALCFDGGDDNSANGAITDGLDDCRVGDPPYMSPDVNTQYYNPEIRYFPAVNHDGTAKKNMDSAGTTGWTLVETDNVSAAATTTYRKDSFGTSVTTANLASGYPDRAWCDTRARDHLTDTVNCKYNSSYTYPNASYPFNTNTSGSRKHKNGAPYYYRLAATEYCTDVNMTSCVAATTPSVSHPIAAAVRYCTNNTLTDCKAKRGGSYTYAKYTGNVGATVANVAGVKARATVTVKNPQGDALAGSISAIVADTTPPTPLISATISQSASFTSNNAAQAIVDAINSNTTLGLNHGYTAARTNNVVTVTAPLETADQNGISITITTAGTAVQRASLSFTVSGVGAGDSVSSIRSGGTIDLIPSSITCTSGAGCSGSYSGGRNQWMTDQIVAAINAHTSGYTATKVNTTITVTAPAGSGAEINDQTFTFNESGIDDVTGKKFAGGTSSGDIETSKTNFTGGVTAVVGASSPRQNVGNFTRFNIVSGQTYSKYPSRTDCTGTDCTYDQEMTNFANWYSYYRSRAQMARTSIGRAFVGLTDAYRVGFITINPLGDLTDRFLAAGDFVSGSGNQKDLWYQALYRQADNGSTPLREALSRVGRYYAGKTTGINAGMPGSPIQVACQPNFAILTTDGYWNGGKGISLTDGTSVGNADNADSGFSKRSEARYDGNLLSTTDAGPDTGFSSTTKGGRNTLADVAMYYYKNDLRSDLADQVPTTSKDTAAHQHMTTFTVGMGLAGLLNFDKGYESGTSADFNRLKIAPAAGGLDWPTPGANDESTLDDLWHAAVNGRGTFFSAQNPAELADALIETLNSLNARVGAGAAAATSNLQPVAGDNFAFTAEFETVSWLGDVKARTIDLSTGTVASRTLWSAAAPLNSRSHETRKIFTYDPNDTSATATVQVGPTVAVTSLTRIGGVATVVSAAHGFADGAQVQIAGATPAGYNISGAITLIDANTFSYPVSTGLASPATGTLTAGPAVTQNGNRLKSFCWVGSTNVIASYTGCSEVQGLSVAEMDYFQPTVASPGSLEPALQQSSTLALNGTTSFATKERLVDFLRGDTTNETTGGTASTDLFRRRSSVMGDIINAQPAYVKGSPFSYNTGNFTGRDPFYQEFRNTTNGVNGTRKGTVYVASNDGYLHAFESDPDGNPYYQTGGIATTLTTDDTFTGTLSTSNTAGEGSERWAYIPGLTLARMKRLADQPYLHRYYTDGTPVVGDVCFDHSTAAACTATTKWRTIIVAGLNAGGRGYYALDVTDPDNPKSLWELTGGPAAACIANDAAVTATSGQTEDCNIGLSYGNPLIVKLPSSFTPASHAGKWAVIVTSGYNNSVSSIGDGVGHLYVVEAQTGKILKRISTGVGDSTTPSGLGRINAWVDSAAFDNTALTVYGGDQLGNLWRFQLQDVAGPPAIATGSVTKITTLVGPGGTAQPITTKPELGEVSSKRVVFVGTGRFLGTDDKENIDRQSVYAIKDNMTSTTSPTVTITRSGSHPTSTISGFVKQTLAASTTNPATERTVATVNPVDFSDISVNGWFVDLPDGATIDTTPDPDVVTAGAERVNVDPILQLGTLVIPSNVPSSDTCVAGGFGWINFLDYKTGGQVPGATANMASTKVSGSLVVGINVVQLPGGTVKAIVTTADNQQLTKDTPVAPSTLQGRRVSWRELFFE